MKLINSPFNKSESLDSDEFSRVIYQAVFVKKTA